MPSCEFICYSRTNFRNHYISCRAADCVIIALSSDSWLWEKKCPSLIYETVSNVIWFKLSITQFWNLWICMPLSDCKTAIYTQNSRYPNRPLIILCLHLLMRDLENLAFWGRVLKGWTSIEKEVMNIVIFEWIIVKDFLLFENHF